MSEVFKVFDCTIGKVWMLATKFCPIYLDREGSTKFGMKMHLGIENSHPLGALQKLTSEILEGGGGVLPCPYECV